MMLFLSQMKKSPFPTMTKSVLEVLPQNALHGVHYEDADKDATVQEVAQSHVVEQVHTSPDLTVSPDSFVQTRQLPSSATFCFHSEE